MKRSHIIISIFVIIIVVGLFIIGYLSPSLFPNELINPKAKIDINKLNTGDFIINQGEAIMFSATNSTDKDGKIEDYQWNFGDGTTSNDVDAVHKFDEPGVYNVTLTVVDDDGNKDVTHIIIRVNNLPIAFASVVNKTKIEKTEIPIYEVIQFDSSGSFDEDGSIDSYYWDLGDGNFSTEQQPTHQYFILGTVKIILTVTDNDGGKGIFELEIEIIKRTYKVEWILKSREEVIESNGYTLEGESTIIIKEILQDNYAYVNITLNWTDRQPLLKNNQSMGQDLFELNILTADNLSKIKNSTDGNISIKINYNSNPAPSEYKAKTANDAITQAIEKTEFTKNGNGEWYFNVSAIECKGGSWQNDIFDLDKGNFWDLKIIIFYYELIIEEVTHS